MATILTKLELERHLEEFRDILQHFDYSSIKNITFLNLDSFFSYMENVEGNPFQVQYQSLQEKLDTIQPYLPFVSADRANQFLEALSHTHSEEEITLVKLDYTKILRDDFIKFARTVTTTEQWARVIYTCEEIRLRKEEMLLALH